MCKIFLKIIFFMIIFFILMMTILIFSFFIIFTFNFSFNFSIFSSTCLWLCLLFLTVFYINRFLITITISHYFYLLIKLNNQNKEMDQINFNETNLLIKIIQIWKFLQLYKKIYYIYYNIHIYLLNLI